VRAASERPPTRQEADAPARELRTSFTSARTASSVAPPASARVAAAWMVGPSASGSEYGTPSSMMSQPAWRSVAGQQAATRVPHSAQESLAAPTSSSARRALAVVAKSGSPAQMKGMRAGLRAVRGVPLAAPQRRTGSAAMLPETRPSAASGSRQTQPRLCSAAGGLLPRRSAIRRGERLGRA